MSTCGPVTPLTPVMCLLSQSPAQLPGCTKHALAHKGQECDAISCLWNFHCHGSVNKTNFDRAIAVHKHIHTRQPKKFYSLLWHILLFTLIGCSRAFHPHWALTAGWFLLYSHVCSHFCLSLLTPPLPFSHAVPLRLSFVHLATKDKLSSAVSPHADKISLKQ